MLIFLLGGVLGTGFGVALGFFLFPFVFPPPPATEQLSEADRAALVATGTFIHANPSDPVHWGSGKVSVYRARGVPRAGLRGRARARSITSIWCRTRRCATKRDVKDSMFVDLGRLRAFKGSQRYAIPAGVDLKKYPSVVIWCEQFGVLISPADLAVAIAIAHVYRCGVTAAFADLSFFQLLLVAAWR